nr:CoA transferase [Frankia nepalensis]
MVESVLNVAAELTVEYTANGASLRRDGNRGPLAAPQGVYRCAPGPFLAGGDSGPFLAGGDSGPFLAGGDSGPFPASADPALGSGPAATGTASDAWIALAVTDDAQWAALCRLLDRADLAADPALATFAGRRATACHDRLDEAIGAWAAALDRPRALAALAAAGIPAAPVTPAADLLANPQLAARGFFERLSHPVVGEHPMPGVAFRLASHPGPLLRRPSPVFGQHDDEVYGGLLGLTGAEIAGLRERGVIADRPAGV